MSQYDLMLDIKIKVDHCDLYFMVQCFLPYILKTFCCKNMIPWGICQYDLMLDFKIKVGHCFMVQ